MNRIRWLAPLTLLGVVLLVFGVEPLVSRVLVAGVALAGSVLLGLGIVGLIQGRLTLGSAFFGMLLLGLGIDFGIHLLVALRDNRAQGLDPDEALRVSMDSSVKPIVFGGLSSALAFGAILLIPNSLTRDMGLTALFGVLMGMVFMLTLLPAGWLLLEKRGRVGRAPAALHLAGLRTIASLSVRYPRVTLGLGLVLAAAGAAGIPRYKVETDLAKIFSRDVPALRVAERVEEIYGAAVTQYIAPVEDLIQAEAWAEALRAIPGIALVVSPTDFMLDDAETRTREMAAALSKTVAGGIAGGDPLVKRLRTALDLGPPRLDALPDWLASDFIGSDGSYALRIWPRTDTLDASVIEQRIREIREIAPTATGVPVIVRIATHGLLPYVPIMVPLVFTVVTVLLIVEFRDRRSVVLALLPVSVATCVTFGFYFWLDLQFSTLTAIVVPVILGLGVDDGIHVVERIRRQDTISDTSIIEAIVGVGRPIFLTTATTCVSFGAFLFADHAGLESIAHFMLMGVPLCFLASITVLPAAAKILWVSPDHESRLRWTEES